MLVQTCPASLYRNFLELLHEKCTRACVQNFKQENGGAQKHIIAPIFNHLLCVSFFSVFLCRLLRILFSFSNHIHYVSNSLLFMYLVFSPQFLAGTIFIAFPSKCSSLFSRSFNWFLSTDCMD